MQTVSMKYIKSRLELFYRSGEPMLLIGLPGIGKTEIISDEGCRILAKHKVDKDGFFLIDFSGLPEESLVLPVINPYGKEDEDKFNRELLPELKRIKEWCGNNPGKRCFVFIDEITSAIQDDQRTLMNFIQSGLLPDGTRLDKDQLFFVSAGNPDQTIPGYEDCNVAVNPIEQAVYTRNATFFVTSTLKDFLEWGRDFNEDGVQNLHPYLVTALEQDGSIYQKLQEDDVRIANSRTLKKLSNIFYTAHDLGMKWHINDIKAYVGDSVGTQLSSIISHLDRLVSLIDLFGDTKVKKLNPEALEKFKSLDDFEKYYIISSALNNNSLISFKTKNNVIKMRQLLLEGQVPPETLLSINTLLAKFLTDKKKRTCNAAQLVAAKWQLEEETNVLSLLLEVNTLQNEVYRML